MNKYYLLLLSAPFFTGKISAQTTMFRGNPDHVLVYNSKETNPFNEVKWKFDASAPVRSTIAASVNSIYFGTGKGLFYSLNKANGKTNWIFNTGSAVNSSPAIDGENVFFSDNRQALYSLNKNTGKVNWKTSLGQSLPYEWAYDYYYSSPTLKNGQVFVGSKDGNVYDIIEETGKVKWKFKTEGIVRSSPAVSDSKVFIGDSEGNIFALDINSGKQIWCFLTEGHGLKNENFGFDRRAIIASPVADGKNIIVGSRDGFLYAIDKNSGKERWRVDHDGSWIISSVAVCKGIVVTGTSDGKFVEGIDAESGKRVWKFKTISVVWSSPIIDNDKVYIGSKGEGTLYCLDLLTGKLIDSFMVGGTILSSPVISGTLLYVGADNGSLYALRPNGVNRAIPNKAKKYVFWEQGRSYFKYGTDVRIRRYLSENGFAILDRKGLIQLLQERDSAINTVVVFANNLFPPEIAEGGRQSLIRSYLDNGGKVVVLGNNPILIKVDPNNGSIAGRSYLYADSVLSIKYGPDDLRSQKGDQPAFATKTGNEWGLEGFWTAPLSLPEREVDIVLGRDENGLASAWVKKFNPAPGSGFVQIWINDYTIDLTPVIKVAEYGLK